jgi:hypothetical protein
MIERTDPFSKPVPAWANNAHYKAQFTVASNPAFKMDKNNKLKKLRDIVGRDKTVGLGAKSAVDLKPNTKPPGHDDQDNRHLKPQQNTDAAQTLDGNTKIGAKVRGLLREVLLRNKKRRKVVRLRPDLSTSGEFPERPQGGVLTEDDVFLRMASCRSYLALLNGVKQPDVEAQAKTIQRTMKLKEEGGDGLLTVKEYLANRQNIIPQNTRAKAFIRAMKGKQ